MNNEAGQEHWLETMATQQMLSGMSDNPRQFHEPPLSTIFRHAWRERFGHRDQVDYMQVPF
jgi:hypothetical protein